MSRYKMTLQLVVCMYLFAPASYARDASSPEKQPRNGMSYEEYSSMREKMRMQMDSVGRDDLRQLRESENNSNSRIERPARYNDYGRGYQSRNRDMVRPDNPSGERAERPEHPRFEKHNR